MTPEVSPTATAPPSDVAAAGLVTVSTEERDGVAVVHVRGEIDVTSAGLLNETINARLAAGDDLVLDCTEVTFMDSTGITCFITAQDHSQRRGVRLVVASDHRAVLRPLQISQLDSVLTIAATVADALTLLGRHHEMP